jgi:hypothetical protein
MGADTQMVGSSSAGSAGLEDRAEEFTRLLAESSIGEAARESRVQPPAALVDRMRHQVRSRLQVEEELRRRAEDDFRRCVVQFELRERTETIAETPVDRLAPPAAEYGELLRSSAGSSTGWSEFDLLCAAALQDRWMGFQEVVRELFRRAPMNAVTLSRWMNYTSQLAVLEKVWRLAAGDLGPLVAATERVSRRRISHCRCHGATRRVTRGHGRLRGRHWSLGPCPRRSCSSGLTSGSGATGPACFGPVRHRERQD